jgi:alpha-1,3-mannosyltransferase
LVASTHGGFFHTGQQAGLKRVWFNTITRASCLAYKRIIACSLSDAEMFKDIAGSRLTTIENGIDQTRLKNAASLTQNRTIIYFGRFAHHKRVGALFPLLRELRQQHPAWRLLVAGREAEQSVEDLRALSVAENVQDAVEFSVDPSDAELHKQIGQATYFLCLSGYEGFGLAAVEAMSAGLFPILSDIAPFKRLNAQTGLGLIVSADDCKAAAAAIEASVTEAPGEHQQRRAALIDSVKRYDWESAAGQYAALYHEVAARPAKREQLAFRQ